MWKYQCFYEFLKHVQSFTLLFNLLILVFIIEEKFKTQDVKWLVQDYISLKLT